MEHNPLNIESLDAQENVLTGQKEVVASYKEAVPSNLNVDNSKTKQTLDRIMNEFEQMDPEFLRKLMEALEDKDDDPVDGNTEEEKPLVTRVFKSNPTSEPGQQKKRPYRPMTPTGDEESLAIRQAQELANQEFDVSKFTDAQLSRLYYLQTRCGTEQAINVVGLITPHGLDSYSNIVRRLDSINNQELNLSQYYDQLQEFVIVGKFLRISDIIMHVSEARSQFNLPSFTKDIIKLCVRDMLFQSMAIPVKVQEEKIKEGSEPKLKVIGYVPALIFQLKK